VLEPSARGPRLSRYLDVPAWSPGFQVCARVDDLDTGALLVIKTGVAVLASPLGRPPRR
jgi:hypothetical protein